LTPPQSATATPADASRCCPPPPASPLLCSGSAQLLLSGRALPQRTAHLTSVTTPGADVTIRCQGQRRNVTFFLHKAGDLNPQRHMDPAGDRVEFRIPTVGRQHGGNYSCSYRPRSEPFVSSEPSDTVQLVVAGEDYPKPNISLHPSAQVTLGEAVTIRCECRCAGVRVLLSKAGDPDARRSMDPPGDVAAFPIRNVSRGDAGSYSCQYRTKWDPPVWSEPSDPVELVISGEGLRSAAPFTAFQGCAGVAPGGAVTIRCECRCRGVRVLLSKAGDPDARRSMDPVGDVAEFPIRSVSRRDAGNYSCQYSTKWDPPVWSEPSNPVELVISGEGARLVSLLPAPHPAEPSGRAVTIRCECRCREARFLLSKAEDPEARRSMDPAGDVAEFPIHSVSRRNAGSYSCQYSIKSNPPIWSEPSDLVELVIAGEGPGSTSLLPAPHPAGPSGGLALRDTQSQALPWAQQRGRLAWEWGRSHWWVLQPGESSSCWRFGAQGGGIPAPRGIGADSMGAPGLENARSWAVQCHRFSLFPPGPGCSVPSPRISADARFNPTDGTDPDGTQQPDPPIMELEGEGEREK
uniref:Ig-like domain-containing protein n=1 Tax=Chrysemys picta bellii TaxID=8478 RepID=A0A8C3P692_CHRPI